MFIRFVTSIFFMLSASAAHADAVADFRLFQSTVQRGSGQFEQIVVAPSGKIKQRGQGSYAFEKPGKFRWEIKKPFPQLIVADGKALFTYDPDLEQATQRSLKGALGESPAALLFGQADLDALFEVTAGQAEKGITWLLAKPRSADALFTSIKLGMKDGVPSVIEINDSLGQITTVTLSEWSQPTDFPPGLFKFEPPPGVDLIKSPN